MKHESSFLLKARLRAGILQADLAATLGISAQFLGRCELGRAHLPLFHLRSFLEEVGASEAAYRRAMKKDFDLRVRSALAGIGGHLE